MNTYTDDLDDLDNLKDAVDLSKKTYFWINFTAEQLFLALNIVYAEGKERADVNGFLFTASEVHKQLSLMGIKVSPISVGKHLVLVGFVPKGKRGNKTIYWTNADHFQSLKTKFLGFSS